MASERFLVPVAVLVALVLRVPALSQPLLEKMGFRQTQTAYTALLFHESGIDLFHPQIPVLGPPYVLVFEFPLFQAVASLPMNLGVLPDLAMRGTNLIFFMITGVLLYVLVRHIAGPQAALASLVFFLFSPFGLVWSRTSMIEYLATAAALGFALLAIAWRQHRTPLLWLLAVLCGSTALLVKGTTGGFWMLPLLAYRARGEPDGIRGWVRTRLDASLVMLVILPIALLLAWTYYADLIKQSSNATAWLTSYEVRVFLFGTLEQRLDVSQWLDIARVGARWVIGYPFLILLPVAALAAFRSHQRAFWLSVVATALLPVLILFNLYAVHDYYQAAITPAVAAILGLGAAWLWHHADARGRRTFMLLTLGSAAFVAVNTSSYWSPIYESVHDPLHELPAAEEIAARTAADDRILVIGRDWSPTVLYYSRRKGMMLPPVLVTPEFVASLPERGYRVAESAHPDTDPLWVLRAWPWVGTIGPTTYVLANSEDDLRDFAAATSDDLKAFNEAAALGRSANFGSVTVQCGENSTAEIQAPAGQIWLRLKPTAENARIRLSPDLAPLPARLIVVIERVLPQESTIQMGCSGVDAITVDEVVVKP